MVTWTSSQLRTVYLTQDGRGLRIDNADTSRNPAPGDLVTVAGLVRLTDTGPTLTNATMSRIGGAELPEPAKASATGLIAGMHNLDRIEIEAVVRRLNAGPKSLNLKLAYAGRTFQATAPMPPEAPPASWTPA